jgi:hypothetical protein
LFRFVKRKRMGGKAIPPPTKPLELVSHTNSEKASFHFPEAHSLPEDISRDHLTTLLEFSRRVRQSIPDLHNRAKAVGWGGSRHAAAVWWRPEHANKPTSIFTIDGGPILWSHYKVMSRYMPGGSNLDNVYYPVKLCRHTGCPAEQSIRHTLEWREKYQPWRVSPAMMEENADGWIYHRGFSPPAPIPSSSAPSKSRSSHGRHALIWFRPGKHRVKDSLAYYRCILNAADRAIGQASVESQGQVSKYNVMIDASDYEWSKVPDFAHTKQAIVMLQDHYPNRLGMIFVAHMSRSAEFISSLIMPLLSKEVRHKIHILSSDSERRAAELAAIVQPEFLPDWLGGIDQHKIDADYYYSQEHFYWSDRESVEFLRTMPYHDVS